MKEAILNLQNTKAILAREQLEVKGKQEFKSVEQAHRILNDMLVCGAINDINAAITKLSLLQQHYY